MKYVVLFIAGLLMGGCTLAINSSIYNVDQSVKHKNTIKDRNVHEVTQEQPNG